MSWVPKRRPGFGRGHDVGPVILMPPGGKQQGGRKPSVHGVGSRKDRPPPMDRGLTENQERVLAALDEYGFSVPDLAQSLGMGASSVTSALYGLRKKGLVARELNGTPVVWRRVGT